jgi:choline transport protein
MSEEVRDSGLTVPRAMVGSILINIGIGFVALISFLFACPSVDDAVNDPSGFPLVYVLNLAGNTNLTLGLIFLQLLILMVGNVAYQASTGIVHLPQPKYDSF